jgi:hypothetical protein
LKNSILQQAARRISRKNDLENQARLKEGRGQDAHEACMVAEKDLRPTGECYVFDNLAQETQRRFAGLSAVFKQDKRQEY